MQQYPETSCSWWVKKSLTGGNNKLVKLPAATLVEFGEPQL